MLTTPLPIPSQSLPTPSVCRRLTPALLCLATLVTLLLATGCGYQHKELFPDQYATVSVPIFGNRTFYRGVEFDLSEALIKEIELRTPYKAVPGSRAQTVLEGNITGISQRQLSRTRTGGLPEEIEVTITVDFVWKDLGTGTVIRERRGFESVGRYVPSLPVSEPFPVAQHQAVQRLATDIVSTMRADW
ncbi:MAG: hypothetical protein GC164_11125 [Phycisphaera sp.]|nr:hypothetical protein [Phycisphaera sp.]